MASGRGLLSVGFLFIVLLMATTVEIWPHSGSTMQVNAASPEIGVTKRDGWFDPGCGYPGCELAPMGSCGQSCRINGDCPSPCDSCTHYVVLGKSICTPSLFSGNQITCGNSCQRDSDCTSSNLINACTKCVDTPFSGFVCGV